MQKITLNKTISARRLSKTGVPTSEPEATIPFGSIIERVERERDLANFRYLTEMYQCPYDLLVSAVDRESLDPAAPEPPQAKPSRPNPPAPAARLEFESIASNLGRAARAKVPGGWLVLAEPGGLAFYPDADHRW